MKFKIVLVIFCISSLSTLAQNRFSRKVGKDFSEGIHNVTPLADNELRLYLNYSYNGPGANTSTYYYALYYPSIDSLSQEKRLVTYGYFYSKNREFFKLSPYRILTTFQECCSEGGRVGMGIDYVYLRDTTEIPTYWLPYMSGTFNPIIDGDSIYIFRSLDSSYVLPSRSYENNSSLVLCHYDPVNQQLNDLDTIQFPFDFKAPGTSFYDVDKRQFELLYDSLQVFFTRGRNGLDSVNAYFGDFFDRDDTVAAYQYAKNLSRHLRIINDSCWYYQDTLGATELRFCKDRFGDTNTTFYPYRWPHNVCSDCNILSQRLQGDSVKAFLLLNPKDSSYHLYREENGLLTQSIQVFNWPKTFRPYSIYSNDDGSFYLAGDINYVYDVWNATGEPMLLKVDNQGRFEQQIVTNSFNLNYNRSTNSLTVFLTEDGATYNYRLIEASGKIMKSGSFTAGEPIQLGDWSKAVYYLQLWSIDQSYIGQEPFIITN